MFQDYFKENLSKIDFSSATSSTSITSGGITITGHADIGDDDFLISQDLQEEDKTS
jgi:hypothetical protein